MKRILSFLLALTLVLACSPVISLQASAATSGYYTYTVSNGKATITGCNTSISGDITIPNTLGGYPVTSIGWGAFSGCTGLTSVTVGDGVTSMDAFAFEGCSSLTDVTIPDSIIYVGREVFTDCSQLTYNVYNGAKYLGTQENPYVLLVEGTAESGISSSTKVIGWGAFMECTGLTEIVIPEGVVTIGGYAFAYCPNLVSVTIPASVTSVEEFAFYRCPNKREVSIADLAAFCKISFLEGASLFEDVDKLYVNGELVTELVIPEGITAIGGSFFRGLTGLTSVTIPNGVTYIGTSAFALCTNLTSIVIPDSVTSIDDGAFSACSSLTDVYYSGTEEQWNTIDISDFEDYNKYLTNATIHFKAAVEHIYMDNGEVVTVSYDTLADALAAVTGGTIKLLADAIVDTVVLKPGVTLDLNGYTLTAEMLIAMNGAMVTDGGADCIGGGLLKIAKENLALAKDNGGVVPVWNGTDGYVFTKVTFQQMARPFAEGAAQYIFLPAFSNADAAALMADGGADNGLKLKVGLEWADGQCQQFYTYDDGFVAQVFASNGGLAFSLTVTGISGIADMTASAMIVTDSYAQATATGTALVAG